VGAEAVFHAGRQLGEGFADNDAVLLQLLELLGQYFPRNQIDSVGQLAKAYPLHLVADNHFG
jgi:hypothetical protein